MESHGFKELVLHIFGYLESNRPYFESGSGGGSLFDFLSSHFTTTFLSIHNKVN